MKRMLHKFFNAKVEDFGPYLPYAFGGYLCATGIYFGGASAKSAFVFFSLALVGSLVYGFVVISNKSEKE